MVESTAEIIAERSPRSSRVRTPSMVVPPGEQTSSLRMSGCFPVSRTILAAPSMDWAASLMESSLVSPLRTPASAMASITMYMKAGELPAIPVMASIWVSGISTATPTAPRISAIIFLDPASTVGPQVYPMAPSRTMQQWLGMTLTISASGTYDFSLAIVRPATMLMTVLPLPITTPSSSKRPGTCLGFTAMTTMPHSGTISEALAYILIPYSDAILPRVASDGAHATISDAGKTFLARRPPMRASAIFPAPMNPIEAMVSNLLRCR